jgi:hypothetical protein
VKKRSRFYSSITVAVKDLIVSAFRPGISFSTAILTLVQVGWFGASLYLISMRIARWYRSPTQLSVTIWWLERLAWLLYFWPWVIREISRFVQLLAKKRERILMDHQHQAYLQFASLMGGLATGLGVGSLLGVSVGPALGVSSRIVFGIEALIGPTILGIIQGGLEGRLVGNRLLRIGLAFLALGLVAVTLIYLTPTLK